MDVFFKCINISQTGHLLSFERKLTFPLNNMYIDTQLFPERNYIVQYYHSYRKITTLRQYNRTVLNEIDIYYSTLYI